MLGDEQSVFFWGLFFVLGLFGLTFGRDIVLDTDSIKDEVDDSISQDGDDKTNDGIKDGVLSVGDFFAIAARKDVTQTAVDEHNHRDNANDVKHGVGDLSKDAINPNKFGWHTISAGSFGTFLDGESHGFASAKSCSGANSSGDL